ncbi:MAG: 50S ribosomal protein L34e [Candidatus Diapherotrites archaeon]|nr:50S ribosomal protein L34e [Candidatus Diapherotrites archaeon]
MPKPSERRKKVKYRKTAKGTKKIFVKGKTSKHRCALCGRYLHGVPHSKRPSEVRKLSKTERRPTAIFGGVLCSRCRTKIIEEAALIKAGAKEISDISLKELNYVKQALEAME